MRTIDEKWTENVSRRAERGRGAILKAEAAVEDAKLMIRELEGSGNEDALRIAKGYLRVAEWKHSLAKQILKVYAQLVHGGAV